MHALKHRGYRRVVKKVMAPPMKLYRRSPVASRGAATPLKARQGRLQRARLVAGGLTKRISTPISDKIRVVSRMRDQVKLSADARWTNVAGACVARGLVTGMILLVDSVFTTGGTLCECAGFL